MDRMDPTIEITKLVTLKYMKKVTNILSRLEMVVQRRPHTKRQELSLMGKDKPQLNNEAKQQITPPKHKPITQQPPTIKLVTQLVKGI